MKRFMTLVTATAIGFGSTAIAQDNMVKTLRVSVSPDAEDANVEVIWPDLESDLQAVMDAKFASLRADQGVDVNVKIIEVSVDGSQILTENEEFNHLEGWVFVRDAADAGGTNPTKVVIDAKTGAVYKDPEGMVVIPDAELFYAAMLNGFADKALDVVENQ